MSKPASRKRKTVNDIITDDEYRKGLQQLLAEQFCCLQKSSLGSVEAGTAAKIGDQMAVIVFQKRMSGIF